ncbi:hypothetical protein [Methylobacterium platani]|uniref:Uncharacterized protein n=2 Tax=Methylobacterium platani TaxID=427683 RepID=A0A179S0K2_9HYPH|nr:hypothetical protein [Methylobacterium platani]KMO15637.1 hypothetical protein SQ03_16905 [Methylobacterium platani JCM 14648]OAS14197.1 hypothetical protein A5481_30415 [Methylobacterium platani]
MNAPLRNTNHIAHGSPEMLRECAAECLNMVSFYTGMAVDYAAATDDVGLNYATRQAVAAMRQAVSILAMLRAMKENGSQNREEVQS